MELSGSRHLIWLAEKIEPPSPGICLGTVGKIAVDAKVKESILACLYDLRSSETRWGLWFCEGFLEVGKLDNDIVQALIGLIPSFLKSSDTQLRGSVMPLVVKLRKDLPKYREWMLQCLNDSDPTVRRYALVNSGTFLKEGEIEPLRAFEGDVYLTEQSMGGPFIYALRNEAFVQIERSVGRTLDRKQISELVDNERIALWWDWRPIKILPSRSRSRWWFWSKR